MGRAILPPVNFPVIAVAAPYPGAGPEEIERLIVQPLEDEIETLPDVERVSASAQNGIAEISVRFHFGSNLDADRANVQQALNAAQANLPPDLIPPVVSKNDPAQAPVLEESITSALVSQTAVSETVTREIEPALRAGIGVGAVLSSGSQQREFAIHPKTVALAALGATPLDILRAVSRSNAVLPGGTLRSRLDETTVGIDAAATSGAALENVPVTIPGSGTVRLRDVAAVEDGYAEAPVISRVDGDPAVVVYVSHAQGADAMRAIKAARKTFSEMAARFPLLRFEELRTDGPYTAAAVNGVLQTLGEGIVLTVLVMLVFLHAWRNALIAAIAIPASLCAAFIAMWALGFTLNVLSLMGLSLTIGILVDDSIVIIEAITRSAERGLRGDAAALAGRSDLGGAAFAITLVDVAVFAPIALMSGVVGEFIREFGLVVVFATAFSLLVAYTLTPALSARWALPAQTPGLDGLSFRDVRTALQSRSRTFPWTFRSRAMVGAIAAWHAALNAWASFEKRAANVYARTLLPVAMRRWRLVLAITAVACLLSLMPLFAGWIPAEFSPPTNRGELTLDLTMPAGTPLTGTDAAASRITAALLRDDRVRHVEAETGRSFNGSADVFASNVAQIAVVLQDPAASGDDVVRRLRETPGLPPEADLAGAGKGMGGAAPISYSISGNANAVDRASARIATALREDPDAADVRSTEGGLRPHLQITVDDARARLLNVSTDDAAQTARIATGGTIAAKAREPAGLVNVVVRSRAALAGDLDEIQQLNVRASDGRLVPLSALVQLKRTQEPVVIQRENRVRVATVSANTANEVPISVVTSRIGKMLSDPNYLPPGAHIEPRGDAEQFLDTAGKMFAALGLSLVAVYVILAVLYRSYTLPLTIMLTVPLASIGAFGLLFVMNLFKAAFPGAALFASQSLNLYSMLGIVMLVGLVAKNGILLVEYAERAMRAGVDALEAMQDAAHLRFRPILMTTFAMIAGMLPLAAGQTIGAEYRKALGTVVIGGLSSSLLLTLFVIPVAYAAFRKRGLQRRDERTQNRGELFGLG